MSMLNQKKIRLALAAAILGLLALLMVACSSPIYRGSGDILTVNGGDGILVEVTPAGVQITTEQLSNIETSPGADCFFGLAVVPNGTGVHFVDDCPNQLSLFHLMHGEDSEQVPVFFNGLSALSFSPPLF